MTLPRKFLFLHGGSDVLYTATVQDQNVLVEWGAGNHGGSGDCTYGLEYVEGNVVNGTWTIKGALETAVAAPVPSLIEQLVSVAAAHCYCFTVSPGGAVTLQDLSEDDPRVIDLKDVETALKWFDLKVQLDALEG